MTALVQQAAVRRRKVNWLPYILSLPALIVCIGILVPFLTAVYYSMLRFRLNLPALKGFVWFTNYRNFLTDAEFWNTARVSIEYTVLTVGDRRPRKCGSAAARRVRRRCVRSLRPRSSLIFGSRRARSSGPQARR